MGFPIQGSGSDKEVIIANTKAIKEQTGTIKYLAKIETGLAIVIILLAGIQAYALFFR